MDVIQISQTDAHVKDNLTKLGAFNGTFAELCRILYKPKITPDDTEIEFLPAQPFDVERIYSEWLAKQNSPVNPVITTLTQHKPIAVMSANPIEAFNANFSVQDVLERNGYKRIGKRYLHPNSSSKVAGVRILAGGAYSDSNDVLNDGRCHDAFDCYRLLECGGDMRQALNWNTDLTRANQRAFFEYAIELKPRVNTYPLASKDYVNRGNYA